MVVFWVLDHTKLVMKKVSHMVVDTLYNIINLKKKIQKKVLRTIKSAAKLRWRVRSCKTYRVFQ